MIAEPMTLLTDYILAGVCGGLGYLLFRSRKPQRARTLWAAAFFALALTALLGGSFHGFQNHLGDARSIGLWKATVLSAGIVSFAMLCGSAFAATHGALRKAVIAAGAIKLLLYEGWMLGQDDFAWVIADTGSALGVVAALHLWSAFFSGDRASRWMLAGVALSVAAAAVQASGIDLHRHFNHNDLYHVIQIAAMIFFYRGARTLEDFDRAREPS